MNAKIYTNQPVWRNIEQMNPDALVLLGDSIYLDIPWVTVVPGGSIHPSEADAADFLNHGFELFRQLLGRPEFASLISRLGPGKAFAIWDDHDFLWNGAAGGAMPSKIYGDHFRVTRTLFKAFRTALGKGNPAAFPNSTSDPVFSSPNEPAPGYQVIDLSSAEKVCLHLTDGRSFRDKHNLLGSAQRAQITLEMNKRPGWINILASGIVFNGSKGECWSGFRDDHEWLLRTAQEHRILVASGDVHEKPPALAT